MKVNATKISRKQLGKELNDWVQSSLDKIGNQLQGDEQELAITHVMFDLLHSSLSIMKEAGVPRSQVDSYFQRIAAFTFKGEATA